MSIELATYRIEDLKPYENNPRDNDHAVEAVAKSIDECSYISPICIDEEGVILCGQTRLKALKQLGYEQTQVILASGLTDEQKRKYRLLDNKTGELAEWEYEALARYTGA